MKRSSDKAAVKKTLVRNCELKTRNPLHKVMYDLHLFEKGYTESVTSLKENELSQPTLCSSESLANYLTEVKKTLPPPLSAEDLNIDKNKKEASSKVTKKLNFHFNDRMYKNLIELNASVEELKTKKDKKPIRSTKKDLEPNIEDFYQDTKELDTPPKVSTIRPRFKPIKSVENGQLHKLVASFDVL